MAKVNQLSIIEADTKDPRVRMKEVRADIKLFVEGSNPWGINHIGEMYTDKEDMVRAIIALQDMYDDRAQRHNKASNHVADLLAEHDVLAQTIIQQNNTIVRLDNAGQAVTDEYNALLEDYENLEQEFAIQGRKLEAALLTLQTVMEG